MRGLGKELVERRSEGLGAFRTEIPRLYQAMLVQAKHDRALGTWTDIHQDDQHAHIIVDFEHCRVPRLLVDNHCAPRM
jgi:hypothetical protein